MRVDGQRHVPAALTMGKRHATHCTGGWVGTRAELEWFGKSCPYRDPIPEPPSPLVRNKVSETMDFQSELTLLIAGECIIFITNSL
jgi:hypothetical protein